MFFSPLLSHNNTNDALHRQYKNDPTIFAYVGCWACLQGCVDSHVLLFALVMVLHTHI